MGKGQQARQRQHQAAARPSLPPVTAAGGLRPGGLASALPDLCVQGSRVASDTLLHQVFPGRGPAPTSPPSWRQDREKPAITRWGLHTVGFAPGASLPCLVAGICVSSGCHKAHTGWVA